MAFSSNAIPSFGKMQLKLLYFTFLTVSAVLDSTSGMRPSGESEAILLVTAP